MPSSPTKERARDRGTFGGSGLTPLKAKRAELDRDAAEPPGARRALSRSPRPKEHAAQWVMMMMIQSGAAPTPKRLLEQHISTEVSSQLRFLSRKWMLGVRGAPGVPFPGSWRVTNHPPRWFAFLFTAVVVCFDPSPQLGRQR